MILYPAGTLESAVKGRLAALILAPEDTRLLTKLRSDTPRYAVLVSSITTPDVSNGIQFLGSTDKFSLIDPFDRQNGFNEKEKARLFGHCFREKFMVVIIGGTSALIRGTVLTHQGFEIFFIRTAGSLWENLATFGVDPAAFKTQFPFLDHANSWGQTV